ncbi:MAG: hypothetical protein AAGJ46_00830 [Planctomycetota bacterium]
MNRCSRVLSSVALLAATLLPAVAARAAVSFTGGVDFSSQSAVTVGTFVPGTLTVSGGSSFFADRLDVGFEAQGAVTVSGVGSTLDVGDARLGINAPADVLVEAGGQMLLRNQFTLGANGGPFSTANVTVTGRGSTIAPFQQSSSQVTLSSGRLAAEDGALIALPGSSLQIGGQGELAVAGGGTINIGDFQNNGTIRGDGTIRRSFGDSRNEGRIEVSPSGVLTIDGPDFQSITNVGDIVVHDGRLVLADALINTRFTSFAFGQTDLRNGVLQFTNVPETSASQAASFSNNGVLSASGGLNDVYGTVRNEPQGEVAVTNNSTLVFHDKVANIGGTISVMPGSRAVFLGGLDMVNATLLANIAGTGDDTGFGIAEVVGAATLSGVVDIPLAVGVETELGDSFPLLYASGGVSGGLVLGDTPELPAGQRWRLEIDANTVSVAVAAPTIAGDFNDDGVVDAADYTVWRDNLGAASEGSIAFAGDGAGGVDVADYNLWRANLGQAAPAAAATPEPLSLALLLPLVAMPGRRRAA